MKTIGQIFLIFFLTQGLFAQTDVKGTYGKNVTWTVAESPYNVIGNVGVPEGFTLTIDPGVVVNFNTTHQIIIQGALVVNGTGSKPVIMNGKQAGAAMVLFQKTNLSLSSLDHISINGPKNGLEFRDFDNLRNTGRIVINRMKLTNSCIAALGTNVQAVIDINNSDFTNSNINNAYKDESIVISHSKITGGQLTAQSYIQPITLYRDTCYNTIISMSGNGMVQAEACIFYKVKFGLNNGSGCKLNLISSMSFNSSFNLWGNEVNIVSSSINYDADYKESFCLKLSTGTISSSEFTGKNQRIAIDRAYSNASNGKFKVLDSDFKGFKIVLKNGEWGSGHDSNTTVNHCNFMDQISDSAIVNLSKYGIVARNNWWGSAKESLISQSIHDFWDDIVYGKVIYTGFLSNPIEKTDLFQIHSLEMSPRSATTINLIKIITKTDLQGSGIRIFKTHYFKEDTLFVETCFSKGFGLGVQSVSDTFEVGYLPVGSHPVVYRARLSSSISDCSLLLQREAQFNFQVLPREVRLNNLNPIPLNPVHNDNVKIATAIFLTSSASLISKNHFIRNDTAFLNLNYYSLDGAKKLCLDTFHLGRTQFGNYTVILSLRITNRSDSAMTNEKVTFKSTLNVLLAELQNFKVSSLPAKPFSGDDITIYTEVKVKPFGKILTESSYIQNDTVFIEQCFFVGNGFDEKLVKSAFNIGSFKFSSFKIVPIRFKVSLSLDSTECLPVSSNVYAWSVQINPTSDIISDAQEGVSLSPNPFNDQIFINGMDVESVEIFDLRGQCIQSFKHPEGNQLSGTDFLPQGIFIFQMTSKEGKIIRKKMVKN